MPIKKQSKKALRQSIKRAEYNLKIKQDLKTLIKKIRQAIDAKQAKDKIEEMLKQAQKSLDKAAQKKIIKKNTGARRMSRLMAYYKKGGKAEVKAEAKKPEKEK
ncbi:MAG TPA: 30S ribosomal protein S20 [Candidatus Uhrbacteria bacterium]|mgnify:CR=1 FL=1|nr:30S ribosomal protein S20 [Candidatus Uhrbacteria bacterium]